MKETQSKAKTPRRYKLLKVAAILTVAMLFALSSFGMLAIMIGCCAVGLIGSGSKNFFHVEDEFSGDRTYSGTKASNVGHDWTVTVTASGGTPTFAPVDGSASGELKVDMDATEEVQNICFSNGDNLGYDIDQITEVGFRVKMNQAAMDSNSQLAFGMIGDRNDTIDSIAQNALFRVIGGDSTTAVVVESDDGTNDLDDKATGQTLINAYKWFVISFAAGTDDVRFFIDGQPVATDTTFDMSNYTGSLQPFIQLQKASDTAADGYTIDDYYIRGRR